MAADLREEERRLRAIHDDESEDARKREVAATAAKFVGAAADIIEQVEDAKARVDQPGENLRAGGQIREGQDPEPLKVEVGETETLDQKTDEQKRAHEAGLPDRAELDEDEKEQIDAEVEASTDETAAESAAAAVPEQDENAEAPDEA